MFLKINPIAFSIGQFDIYWYGIAYAISILLCSYILKYLDSKHQNLIQNKNAADSIMVFIALGIIIGGRIGYVLFYHPNWILVDPIRILLVWQGGMSFHGGAIGAFIGLTLWCRTYNIRSILYMTDLLACVCPLGLFFGRVANFINGELQGKPTSKPWGIVFPSIDMLPRHPSALYESFAEGILLLILMMGLFFYSDLKKSDGKLTGACLLGYGLARTICELWREPDAHIGYLYCNITMGQLLTLPMFLIGFYLLTKPNSQSINK